MYDLAVTVSYDSKKSERNVALRGLSFECAADFELMAALVLIDDRRDYGEIRFRAFGQLYGRPHVMVFTEIARGIRVISLRRANKREVKRYGR